MINKEDIKTEKIALLLKRILFEYLKTEYKQFNWKIYDRKNDVDNDEYSFSITSINLESKYVRLELSIEKEKISVSWRYQHERFNTSHVDYLSLKINGINSEKKVVKIANKIFKWFNKGLKNLRKTTDVGTEWEFMYPEEVQGLNTQQINTLVAILFKNVKDKYKQFKWKLYDQSIKKLEGIKTFRYSMSTINTEDYYIRFAMQFSQRKIRFECMYAVSKAKDENYLPKSRDELEVPLSENKKISPKELNEITKMGLGWFKQWMEKITPLIYK